MSAWLLMIFMSPLMTLCMNAATLSVLWFGGRQVMAGSMSTGDLTSFITYITQVLNSLMMVSMLFIQMTRAMASARRVREVMEEVPDISDTEAAHPELTVREGSVELRHVSFRYYKDSAERVLDDINLNIPAGSTVGIIGSTGSGKSTLVSLIPRLYDADEGEVLVDGVNVKDWNLHNLRAGIGMVLQKNVLFSGTVRDNLLWGDENADDETLRRAARDAQADGFVSAFPEGYSHDIEQGGTNVSGGQKQRLCIARALLAKPKILILDDSTSAVDTATEARIRQALHLALGTSMVFAAFWTGLSELFPQLYIHIFMRPSAEILAIAPAIIRRYSVSFVLLPVNIFSTYYFQSILHPKDSFIVSIARGLLVSGLLIFALPALFAPEAIWWAMPLTELVTSVYAAYAMRKSLTGLCTN